MVVNNTKAEHLTWQDIIKAGNDTPKDILEAIDIYFEPFAALSKNCLKCGTKQGGLMGMMMGGFTWGLIHGEGHCGNCDWPGRAIHRIKDAQGEEIATLDLILQYHPDHVTKLSKHGNRTK